MASTGTAFAVCDLPPLFHDKIAIRDGHWIWIGQINNKGYGLIHSRFPARPEKRPGKRAAHFVIYELLVGLVPVGLELDHTCPFTACVFPGCMDEVTHAENQRRMGQRLTHCRAKGHPRTPENLRVHRNGSTSCLLCASEREAQRALRKRVA